MEWKTIVTTVGIVSLCFFAVPIRIGRDTSQDEAKLFKEYVEKYKKPYKQESAEYEKRFERFQQSLRHIEEMNLVRSTEDSAIYGLTKFSDMSQDEFLTTHLQPGLPVRSKKHNKKYHHKYKETRSKRSTESLPLKFDWREKNVISAIKNQGNCGACWAFSTVETAESMFAIANKTLRIFSTQEMIDCAENSNFGCEGGDICSLLTWLVSSKTKILPEVDYPLTRTTDVCKIQKIESGKSEVGIRISNFTCDNYVGVEEELLSTIAHHGPVAVAINALSWQNYLGGVIQYHCDGSFETLNHAVQIVGYDKTGSTPHYVVRNSWGTSFGDKGYLYIAIGGNLCGIANQVSALNIMY